MTDLSMSKSKTDLECEEKHLCDQIHKIWQIRRALHPAEISWMIRSFYQLQSKYPDLIGVDIDHYRDGQYSGHSLSPIKIGPDTIWDDKIYLELEDKLSDIGCMATEALEYRADEISVIVYLSPLRIVQEHRWWSGATGKYEVEKTIDLTQKFLEGVTGLEQYLEKPK